VEEKWSQFILQLTIKWRQQTAAVATREANKVRVWQTPDSLRSHAFVQPFRAASVIGITATRTGPIISRVAVVVTARWRQACNCRALLCKMATDRFPLWCYSPPRLGPEQKTTPKHVISESNRNSNVTIITWQFITRRESLPGHLTTFKHASAVDLSNYGRLRNRLSWGDSRM